MQHPDWISQLLERADIGKTARSLKPRASTESVIGRLPQRLQKLWAAYTLQADGVASILRALDAQHDYTRPISGAEPLECPTLTHETNKLRLMYWVFWLAVHDEFRMCGNLGVRQHWQLVSIPD